MESGKIKYEKYIIRLFPAERFAAGESEMSEEKHTENQGAEKRARTGTVLVMDDDISVREIIAAMLEAAGFRTAFASDGREAVELYKAAYERGEPFVCVIMDLTVPHGMGATEALKKLKDVDPNVCAVISSGYSEDPAVLHYEKYGFAAVLSKPFRSEDLESVLTRALARAR